jgi:hypothetical protein
MKLNVKAFALTCAILWGFGLFAATWWIMLFDGATHERFFIGGIYRGYNVSAIGSLLGLVYAFFDGLIGGAFFAWIYNAIVGGKESAAHRS